MRAITTLVALIVIVVATVAFWLHLHPKPDPNDLASNEKQYATDPETRFLQDAFKYDVNARRCYARVYPKAQIDLPAFAPEGEMGAIHTVVDELYYPGSSPSRPLTIGVARFPDVDQIPLENAPASKKIPRSAHNPENDLTTNWNFKKPYPRSLINPARIPQDWGESTIQHDAKVLDNPTKDKTNHMDILNRWVRMSLPANALSVCRGISGACPCISTTKPSDESP